MYLNDESMRDVTTEDHISILNLIRIIWHHCSSCAERLRS